MNPEAIRSILVVGGGSAGWMAATAIAHAMRSGVRIELVESDEIGIVGVGEATIPPIRNFNKALELAEDEFVRATGGSFKLGIEFVNWGRSGHRYFHPFGKIGRHFDSVPLHQHWLKQRLNDGAPRLEALSLAAAAAARGRFSSPVTDPKRIESTLDYAYHFDAGLYAAFLRRRAEQLGVVRHEGRIVGVEQDGDSGRIDCVTLQDGRKLSADLFIDCSGFRGLLIEDALKSGFEDWSHWLPCDRALAVPTRRTEGSVTPFTRSTAHKAGWQWRIPLQHRTGNGHVYCSRFISDDEAARVLLDHVDEQPLAEPRLLRFTAGRRKRPWIGNCVALGLAAGFLEPLESTSIHLVQSGIARLLTLFPTRNFEPFIIEEFNRASQLEWEGVRDFIILHYYANERAEKFWTERAETPVPDSLERRIEHFRSYGRLMSTDSDLFQNDSWLAVLIGQFVLPEAYHPMVDARPKVPAAARLADFAQSVSRAVEAMPTHGQFIEKNCRSELPVE